MKQNPNVIQKELEQRLAALDEKHKVERIKLDERHSSERKSTEVRYEQRMKGLAREGKRVNQSVASLTWAYPTPQKKL